MIGERTAHRRGLIKVGCITVLILVVLALAAGFWTALNWRDWAAEGSRKTFAAMIERTGLSDEQKRGMTAHVDALAEDFRAGRVTAAELLTVVERVSRSPIIPAAIVDAMYEGYVRPSSLSDDEKADAKVTLQRFARGVFERTIPEEAIGPTLGPISAPRSSAPISIGTGTGEYHLKDPKNVTADELREFLANARAKADEAGVPDEAFEVDYAAELGGAIDAALGRRLPEPESVESGEG